MTAIYELALATVPVRRRDFLVATHPEPAVPSSLPRIFLLTGFLAALHSAPMHAQTSGGAMTPRDSAGRDGQHDFDWEIGTWKTQLKYLTRPLTGSSTWVDYEGTSIVRKVLDGRANLVELNVRGPTGRIEGLSLRLYNPEARQWSLNFSSARTGTLSPPVIGEFKNGRGEFYGQEFLGGRAILVRFIISEVTPSSARFEQAFSDDGGKTWEVNWIAVDTRMKDGTGG
jgi:hypothetical protein